MSRYRDKLQIIADILSIASKPATKTRIMYQANLSHKLLGRYLTDVLKARFVSFENGNQYVLTPKGKEFLNRHNEYAKRCKTLGEHLTHINNDKTLLEKMCYSTGESSISLNRQVAQKTSRK